MTNFNRLFFSKNDGIASNIKQVCLAGLRKSLFVVTIGGVVSGCSHIEYGGTQSLFTSYDPILTSNPTQEPQFKRSIILINTKSDPTVLIDAPDQNGPYIPKSSDLSLEKKLPKTQIEDEAIAGSPHFLSPEASAAYSDVSGGMPAKDESTKEHMTVVKEVGEEGDLKHEPPGQEGEVSVSVESAESDGNYLSMLFDFLAGSEDAEPRVLDAEVVADANVETVVADASAETQEVTESKFDADNTDQVVQAEIDSNSDIEFVNRLSSENPTAAGTPIDLSEVALRDKPVSRKAQHKQIRVLEKFSLPALKTTDLEWRVENNWDSDHLGMCRLSTGTLQVDQHDYTTQIWLNVERGRLLVNATTNIDIELSGVGIKAGNGQVESFDKKHFSGNVEWSGDLAKVLSGNDEMRIIIGGTDLGRYTHEASIGLKGLKAVYPSYKRCLNTFLVSASQ